MAALVRALLLLTTAYLGESDVREALEGERVLLAVASTLPLSGVDAAGRHRGDAHPVSHQQDHVASDPRVDRCPHSALQLRPRRRFPVHTLPAVVTYNQIQCN